jgi:hypothetical protein
MQIKKGVTDSSSLMRAPRLKLFRSKPRRSLPECIR